jgi:RHS repeat-associated protein
MHAVTRRSGCRTRVGAISMGMRPWLQSALMLASPWIDAQTLVDVLQYDGRGNILQRTTDGSAVVYLYDGLDRLRAEGALGGQTFELDPDGGRLADRRSHYRVLPGGQRLADRDGMALVHGPAGHLLADSAWRNGRWAQRSFDWTLAGQLKSVRIDGVLAATYLYNDARQRTRKTLAQPAAGEPAVTLYRHDPEGRLVMEVAGTAAQAPGIAVAPGQVLVRYVWQDAVPVAVVWPPMTPGNPNASTDRIVYLHVDHLNTPRRASDDRGVVVWQWQSDAFGERPPDEDADRDGRRTTINLRFPGQYFDAESGLHYNWHRYYDPQVGRYTQVDPIGLAGGINTYAYVEGNPVSYSDPLGLKTFMCTKPLHGLGKKWGPRLYPESRWNPSPAYHQFLCVKDATGKVTCGGQDRSGSAVPGSPGKPSDDSWPTEGNGSCVPKDDRDCVDQCVIKAVKDPKRPWYAIGSQGTDCQEWADEVIKQCQKQCSAKKK